MTRLAITEVDIDDIRPYEKNTRKHPKAQIRSLAGVIKRLGFRVPVILDENKTIISGHGRWLAARHLGMTQIPAIMCDDMSEDEKAALRIADNRMYELGQTDTEMLAEELSSLASIGWDMSDIGFADDVLEQEMDISPDIDVHELEPEFWITIRGPLTLQPDTLDALSKQLRGIEGLLVDMGVL